MTIGRSARVVSKANFVSEGKLGSTELVRATRDGPAASPLYGVADGANEAQDAGSGTPSDHTCMMFYKQTWARSLAIVYTTIMFSLRSHVALNVLKMYLHKTTCVGRA